MAAIVASAAMLDVKKQADYVVLMSPVHQLKFKLKF
jgi:hypothetical protein